MAEWSRVLLKPDFTRKGTGEGAAAGLKTGQAEHLWKRIPGEQRLAKRRGLAWLQLGTPSLWGRQPGLESWEGRLLALHGASDVGRSTRWSWGYPGRETASAKAREWGTWALPKLRLRWVGASSGVRAAGCQGCLPRHGPAVQGPPRLRAGARTPRTPPARASAPLREPCPSPQRHLLAALGARARAGGPPTPPTVPALGRGLHPEEGLRDGTRASSSPWTGLRGPGFELDASTDRCVTLPDLHRSPRYLVSMPGCQTVERLRGWEPPSGRGCSPGADGAH